jgi:hypothetical protein
LYPPQWLEPKNSSTPSVAHLKFMSYQTSSVTQATCRVNYSSHNATPTTHK